MSHPNLRYESAQKDLEHEKKMVAALKRLSIGHLMSYDPDLPMEDLELAMQYQEQRYDDEISSKNLRASRSNSNSPRSTPSVSPEKSKSSTPSPAISPSRLGLAPEAVIDRKGSEEASRDFNVSSARRPSSLQRTPSIKRSASRGNASSHKEAEKRDDDEIPLDANTLMWVPASLHPEVDPDNFKNHVKTTVEEIMERQLSRKSSLNRHSSLSKSISRTDPKPDTQTVSHPQDQQHTSSDQLTPRTDTSATNRFSNPSLKELSNELEQLSRMAGRDSTDAITVARTLSASSLGYTDVEILAIDELSSTPRTTTSSNSSQSPSPVSSNEDLVDGSTSPTTGRPYKYELVDNSHNASPNDFALKRSRRYDYRKPVQSSGSKFQTTKAGKLADLRNSLSPELVPQMVQSSYHLQLKDDAGSRSKPDRNLPSIPQSGHNNSHAIKPSSGRKCQPAHAKSSSINPRSSQLLFNYRNPSHEASSVPTAPLNDSPYSITSTSSLMEDKLSRTKYSQHNLTAQGLYQMKQSPNMDASSQRVQSSSHGRHHMRHSRSAHRPNPNCSQNAPVQDQGGNRVSGKRYVQGSSHNGQKKLQPQNQFQPQAYTQHSASELKARASYDNFYYPAKTQQSRDKYGHRYGAQREVPADHHSGYEASHNSVPHSYNANNTGDENLDNQRIVSNPLTQETKGSRKYIAIQQGYSHPDNDKYHGMHSKGNGDNFKSLQLNENLDLLRSEINEFKESLNRIERKDKAEKLNTTNELQPDSAPELDISFDQTYQDISYEDKLGIESEISEGNDDIANKPSDDSTIENDILSGSVSADTEVNTLNDEIDSHEISDQSSFDVSPKDDNREQFPSTSDSTLTETATDPGPPIVSSRIHSQQSVKKKKSWAWLREKDKESQTHKFKRSTSVDSNDAFKESKGFKITARSVSSPEIHIKASQPEVKEKHAKESSEVSKSLKLEPLKEEKHETRTGAGPKEQKDLKDSIGKENVITKFFKKKRTSSVSQPEELASSEKGVIVDYESDNEKKTNSIKKGSNIFKKKGKKDSETKSRLGLKILKSTTDTNSDEVVSLEQSPTKHDEMEIDDEERLSEVKKKKWSTRRKHSEIEREEARKPRSSGDAAHNVKIPENGEDENVLDKNKQDDSTLEAESDDKALQSTLEVEEKLKKSIKRTSRANQPIKFTDSAFGFPLPPPSPSTLVMLSYRFPVHVERAIYRLSHLKLANPKRSLREQVLLSNFMYAYLNLVDHTLHLEQLNGENPEAQDSTEVIDASLDLQENSIHFDTMDTNEVYTGA